MEPIKIKFTDFWQGFQPEDFKLFRILSRVFPFELSDSPQFLFYSAFGVEYKSWRNVTKIFYSGEPVSANFAECEFALTFDYSRNSRHYRLPLYLHFCDLNVLTLDKMPERILSEKRKFCNFIYSNDACEKKEQILS